MPKTLWPMLIEKDPENANATEQTQHLVRKFEALNNVVEINGLKQIPCSLFKSLYSSFLMLSSKLKNQTDLDSHFDTLFHDISKIDEDTQQIKTAMIIMSTKINNILFLAFSTI